LKRAPPGAISGEKRFGRDRRISNRSLATVGCETAKVAVEICVMFFGRFCFIIVSTPLALAAAGGSCDPLLFGEPQNFGTVQSNDITEGSGLAASWRNPGVLWTHNDGSRDILYAITMDGRLLGKYHLNKSTEDVEDIAVGPGPVDGRSYVYAADIGSNNSDRSKIKIFRAPEPEISINQESARFDLDGVDSFALKYPDGTFDAEALLVDPIKRELFVVTKEAEGATIFRIGLDQMDPNDSQTMELVGRIPFVKVSGATVSKDGLFVALRREDQAEAWYRAESEDLAQTLQRPATFIPVVGPPAEPNGEGITFLPDDSGYITFSEGLNQPLYFFSRLAPNGEAHFVGAPHVTPTGLDLQVSACAGMNFAVERSVDLQTWANMGNFQANGEVQTIHESDSTPRAFYRLRTE
jgi:hypothetical protein